MDFFLSRDLDSRISEREVAAVNEWMESGWLHSDKEVQGGRKEVKKSNYLVGHKSMVKLLFFAHQLSGNLHPFSLITLPKHLHLLL